MQNNDTQDRFEDDRDVDLRQYVHTILKRKNVVLTLSGIVFLISVLVTFATTPIYTSSSEVLIERNHGSAAGLDNQYAYYDPDFIETQSQIIKSFKVARRVVENLKLDTVYRHFFLGDKEKSKPGPAGVHPGGKDESGRNAENSLPAGAGQNSGNAASVSDGDAIAMMIQSGLNVELINKTKIVRITYSNKYPNMAKMVADGVVKAYMDEMLDMKLSTSRYALQWMTAKADDEKMKLEKSEEALQQYMRANDLVTVENKLAIYPQKLTELSTQLTKAQGERKSLEDVLNQIKEAGSNTNKLENVPIFVENGVLKNLRDAIFKARQNIKELSKKYGPKHPVMMKANDELGELLHQQQAEIGRVVATTNNSYELAASQEKNLQDLLNATKNELLNLNEKFIQYSIMKRDVDSNRAVYEALTSSMKKEAVTEQSQSINIWVVKGASQPGAPSKPNKKLNLTLGVFLGLMCGVGCAFLIEYLDNTVKSEKDLEIRFGLTVLGTVEQLKEPGSDIESYVLRNPLSPVAESYRLIRSGLLLSSAEHPPKTVLVTSMVPKEGKTSTSINIARMLSQSNQKVLIVDCDLRRPRMHSIFGIENNKGLSNFLTGNTKENIVQKIPEEEIFMIPSGPIPPNPAELLSARKMRTLIEKMSENFDFVILDSPPIQSVTDSLALTQIVDGVVVVVRAGKTTHEMLHSGLKKLADTRCHLLGSVLNGQSKANAAGSYYSGYTSYYAKDGD